jgi:hypothetical protein
MGLEKHASTGSNNELLELALEVAADTNPAAAKIVLEMEDTNGAEDNADTPRRRLLVLRSVIRKLLFQHQGKTTVSQKDVKKVLSNITENEQQVALLIVNFLLPYIPLKKRYRTLAYQIPFILMANDVLCSTGYSKFSMNISPLSKPSC